MRTDCVAEGVALLRRLILGDWTPAAQLFLITSNYRPRIDWLRNRGFAILRRPSNNNTLSYKLTDKVESIDWDTASFISPPNNQMDLKL